MKSTNPARLLKRALCVLAATLTVFVAVAAPASAHGTSKAKSHYRLGYTQVAVAPAVVDLITSAGITPAPTGAATAYPYKGTLAAAFPITGIQVFGLKIKHTGGLSLTAGSAAITLSDFTIDLARLKVSANVSGSAVGNVGRVDVFSIRLSDNYGLGLVKLTLNSTSAGALNATFGVSAFAAGNTFGYATPKLFAAFPKS